VIFFDPMLPKRKKTALVAQEMQVLQSLIGEDFDANETFALARGLAQKRVVVKRPLKAEAFHHGGRPGLSFRGKTTRFDIYFPHRITHLDDDGLGQWGDESWGNGEDDHEYEYDEGEEGEEEEREGRVDEREDRRDGEEEWDDDNEQESGDDNHPNQDKKKKQNQRKNDGPSSFGTYPRYHSRFLK
jgi:hypothetical protein